MRCAIPLCALVLLVATPVRAGEAVAYMMVRDSPLAGFRYNDGRLVWNDLRTGDALVLVREPDNPFDADAIRLEWNGRKIGYVPRRENGALARELDAGKTLEARIIELSRRRNGRHLIGYDILVPLHAAREAMKESK